MTQEKIVKKDSLLYRFLVFLIRYPYGNKDLRRSMDSEKSSDWLKKELIRTRLPKTNVGTFFFIIFGILTMIVKTIMSLVFTIVLIMFGVISFVWLSQFFSPDLFPPDLIAQTGEQGIGLVSTAFIGIGLLVGIAVIVATAIKRYEDGEAGLICKAIVIPVKKFGEFLGTVAYYTVGRFVTPVSYEGLNEDSDHDAK